MRCRAGQALVSQISIKANMMSDFIKSQPHRAYGFEEMIF